LELFRQQFQDSQFETKEIADDYPDHVVWLHDNPAVRSSRSADARLSACPETAKKKGINLTLVIKITGLQTIKTK